MALKVQQQIESSGYKGVADADQIAYSYKTENGIEVIELKEDEYINKDNLKEYTVDGLHPNNAGYMQIADAVYRNIVATFCQ